MQLNLYEQTHTIDFEGLARLGRLPFTIDIRNVLLQQRRVFQLQTRVSYGTNAQLRHRHGQFIPEEASWKPA